MTEGLSFPKTLDVKVANETEWKPWFWSEAGGAFAALAFSIVTFGVVVYQGYRQTSLLSQQNQIQLDMAVWQKAQGVSQDALQKQIQKSQEDRKEIEFFNVVSERHVQTHSGTFQHYYSEEDYRRWYGAFLDACEYFLFLCEGNLIKSPDLRQYIDRFRPRAKEASYYLLTHSHPHYSKRVKVWLG